MPLPCTLRDKIRLSPRSCSLCKSSRRDALRPTLGKEDSEKMKSDETLEEHQVFLHNQHIMSRLMQSMSGLNETLAIHDVDLQEIRDTTRAVRAMMDDLKSRADDLFISGSSSKIGTLATDFEGLDGTRIGTGTGHAQSAWNRRLKSIFSEDLQVPIEPIPHASSPSFMDATSTSYGLDMPNTQINSAGLEGSQRSLDELELRVLTRVENMLEESLSKQTADLQGILHKSVEPFGLIQDALDALHNKWMVAKNESVTPPSLPKMNVAEVAKEVSNAPVSSTRKEEFRKNMRRMVTDDKHEIEKSDVAAPPSNHLPMRADGSSQFAQFIGGDMFNALCSIVIIINTVVLGVEIDHAITNLLHQQSHNYQKPAWSHTCNLAMTGLFIIELMLRLAAERLDFILGRNRWWNIFDAAMVGFALSEELLRNHAGNVSFFRVFKIFKMFRTLRILRVFRHFRELRLMICSIIASFASLMWAFLLLLVLTYCSSLLMCQGVVDRLMEERTVDSQDRDLFLEFYSSVPDAMYTHIMAISGGKDWYDFVIALETVSLWHVCLFTLYILFVVFGMLNVLTGVFVDQATEFSHLDRDLIIDSQKRKVQDFSLNMRKIFEEIDTDGTGDISWPEFKIYCQRDDVMAYLSSMDLNVQETQDLFRMLDVNQTGMVHIDDFINGCMRMKGQARSLDLLHLQEDITKLKRLLVLIGDELNLVCEMMEMQCK